MAGNAVRTAKPSEGEWYEGMVQVIAIAAVELRQGEVCCATEVRDRVAALTGAILTHQRLLFGPSRCFHRSLALRKATD